MRLYTALNIREATQPKENYTQGKLQNRKLDTISPSIVITRRVNDCLYDNLIAAIPNRIKWKNGVKWLVEICQIKSRSHKIINHNRKLNLDFLKNLHCQSETLVASHPTFGSLMLVLAQGMTSSGDNSPPVTRCSKNWNSESIEESNPAYVRVILHILSCPIRRTKRQKV